MKKSKKRTTTKWENPGVHSSHLNSISLAYTSFTFYLSFRGKQKKDVLNVFNENRKQTKKM